MELFFSGIGSTVTVLTAVITLGVWLYETRKKQLRIDDVLIWSNQCIEVLQEIYLYCDLDVLRSSDADCSRIRELAVSASVLVEKGRLFFRNNEVDGHGREKEPAYRGYRPLILDKLVLAHKIAIRWEKSSDIERMMMREISAQCVAQFVSLIRAEVGRVKTASKYANKDGFGSNLDEMLKYNFKPERLD
ncbi:MAG: hypothetical protein RIR97_817 [Pseudomonadota bacterium]|jgi:hypothetical protein